MNYHDYHPDMDRDCSPMPPKKEKKEMSDDMKFGLVCAAFLFVVFGSLAAGITNADEDEWVPVNDDCYTNIHEHRSWSFNDYTTINTYCLKNNG